MFSSKNAEAERSSSSPSPPIIKTEIQLADDALELETDSEVTFDPDRDRCIDNSHCPSNPFGMNSTDTTNHENEPSQESNFMLVPKTELIIYENESDDDEMKITEISKPSESESLQNDCHGVNIQPSSLSFECESCSSKMNSEPELIIHKLICSRSQTKHLDRYCSPCNKMFCNPRVLQAHTLSFHSSAEEKSSRCFKCELCPKIFGLKSSLLNHMEMHRSKEDKRVFKCEVCGSDFYRKDHLTSHLRTHSDDRPFPCPLSTCDKSFKFKYNLNEHLAFHSDTRSVHCPHPNCGKSFKTKPHMKEHLKTHSGERPFKCMEDNCVKAFATSSTLKRHKRSFHSQK